jgi:hypothetical protein
MRNESAKVPIPILCTECNQNEAMHWVSKSRIERNLCCVCHIKEGNPPTSWHSDCIKAYRASSAYALQKFHKGDWVRVAKDLGSTMSHFESDCEAIVIGSYADQYPGFDSENTHDFTIFIKGRGQVSWYGGNQLILIETGRIDLLEQWESEKAVEVKEKSDLDWIFSHGQEVTENPHGASIQSLASCFGLDNLWGSRGEGATYYSNAIMTMQLAMQFLIMKDKIGWLEFCEELKLKHEEVKLKRKQEKGKVI